MASNVFTACSASTLVSTNRTLSPSPSPIGLGPRFALSRSPSLKAPSLRPSGLVVKAQQGGNPNQRLDPVQAEQFRKKVALLETSPYVRTPWNTTEDDHEIRMWFDMPGLAAENIHVVVEDDLLYITGDGGVDAFGNKIYSPCDSRIQLPHNSWKEEITAVFKNGVLYITVPKILKFEQKVIHIPVRAA